MVVPRSTRFGLKPGSLQAQALRHRVQLLERVGLHVPATLPAPPEIALERVVDVNAHALELNHAADAVLAVHELETLVDLIQG